MSTDTRTHILSIAECLETLEDGLFSKKSRTQAFQDLHLIFQDKDRCEQVTSQEALRILTAYEKCLYLDIQCVPLALNTVLSLLSNANVVITIPAQDLLPSVLSTLHFLKTLSASETQHLRTLGVQVFLSYPVDVITVMITNNLSEIQEIIEDFIPDFQQGGCKTLSIFLKGLLAGLPQQIRRQLIQDALPTWFKIIGVVMEAYSTCQDKEIVLEGLDCLELLTEAFVNVDYFQCPLWQNEILKNICDSKMYPAIILKQLQRGNTIWHRFWIAIVKLLKNQITRSCPFGTPIHPMLEVVESAFKMDADNRYRAFKCWDVLIDNLSSDTNEKVPRYIKLLLIPLKLTNAKTEETARAKFYTWWNLIIRFQSRLDQFTEEVLLEFMNFMFGSKAYKKQCEQYHVFAAGQMYDSLRTLCLQAFAEIVGHDASCKCSSLPKLNHKLLNNKLLASHWDIWMISLKTAILFTNTIFESDNILEERMEVLCVWKAFVNSISELPPNGVRKDMFNELIQVLLDIFTSCTVPTTLPDVLFSLALSLTEDNENIRKLVVCKGDVQPLQKLVSVITNPKMVRVFERYETKKVVEILRPFIDMVVASCDPKYFVGCLKHDSRSLKIWTALAHSLNESQIIIDINTVKYVLMWPVWAMEGIVDIYTVVGWQNLYNAYAVKLSNTDFDILANLDVNHVSYFKYIATVCILKSRLLFRVFHDADEYVGILENVTAQAMQDYKQYKESIPMLVDTTVELLDKISSATNSTLALSALNCASNILLMFFSEIQSQVNKGDNQINANITIMMDNIFKTMQPISKTPLYSDIFCNFLKVLTEYITSLQKKSFLSKYLLLKLNYLQLDCPIKTVKIQIDKCIKILTEIVNKVKEAQFTSPNVKNVKRPKKRETIIVNTVTENGEEYAVVNSNWKFNPKNLTENQKEKLQRKREDIPALYQDLSQSQDEFKLSKWKTDSQDTTTSTSNSKSSKLTINEEASNILKNIPSSDVVPNIMQNILSDNHISGSGETNAVCVLQTDNNKSDQVEQSSSSTPKNTKSPRMALKDRVFRNVRVLIEKSSYKNDTTIVEECQIKRTPTKKTINNANLVNSAPSMISADRPSRVKRIPKKFADVQLFGLKKRRYSLTDSQSQSGNELENSNDINNDEKDKNTAKADLSVVSDNAVNDQCIIEKCDAKEVKEAKSVQDAQEVTDLFVSQVESTKDVSEKLGTEISCSTHYNEHTPDIQKDDNIVNVDNNNVNDRHDKEDAKNNINSQKPQKNDEFQCLPKEEIALDTQNKDNSPNCQQIDDVEDVQMEEVTQEHLKNECDHKVTDVNIVEVTSVTDYKSKQMLTTKTQNHKKKEHEHKVTDVDIAEFDSETDFKNKQMVTVKSQNHKSKEHEHKITDVNIAEFDSETDFKNKQIAKAMTQNHKKNEIEHDVIGVNIAEIDSETDYKNKQTVPLKTPDRKIKQDSQKFTGKRSSTKKSRIEKELAIDMVEGHPFLKLQSDKRVTRKKLLETETTSRKGIIEKPNNKKTQSKTSPKQAKKPKDKKMSPITQDSFSVTIGESQERNTLPEDAPCSEDVIESSQDSNFTAVTVKSTKRTPKRQTGAPVEKLEVSDVKITETQDLLQDSDCEIVCVINKSNSQNDIELPQNKTAEVDKNQSELTENMDTEPVVSEKIIDDVIIINDEMQCITVNSEKSVDLDTQELAEADTQPNDPADFVEYESNNTLPTQPEILSTPMDVTESMSISKLAAITAPESQDVIEILTEPNCDEQDSDICSPFKDDAQRKQDFLNNTSEISPIKVQSPAKDKTSPEKKDETSSDYLVVKLSSPVHSNGEPFSSQGSPEIFTEDKTSPDKRDQSPPRVEVSTNSGSPSSSLSLKRNRTQNLRPGGRAAHMIGLCVPDSVSSKKNADKIETEEPKKPNTSTPARRNLRVLYNAVSENGDILDDNEKDNFLKLRKALPSVDSSPAVPILKRKIDIVDDTSASPASKRKRVSFHDPPVSTTVSVQKYIKPDCIEPPSVTQRRLEAHITRSLTKSPKRMDNTLKLDTVLSKAIESFAEQTMDSLTNDTNTLDVTPAIEVVVTSELNDTDPICPDLIDCKDPIEMIAADLSSPAMKDLFIKELDGKLQTVGDLAKMTELEVNRLCIKAPKVQVAKKVLAGYVNRRVISREPTPEPTVLADETAIAKEMNEIMSELEPINVEIETQTDDVSVCETESQTINETMQVSTQTASVPTADTNTQTLESGFKTTSDIISSCLSDREDFTQRLGELLPKDAIVDILVNRAEDSTPKHVVTKLWDRLHQELPISERSSKEFSVIKDILIERYDSRDLILFCSRLLQGLYDKST